MRGCESFPPTKKVLLDTHSSVAMGPFNTTLKTFLCLFLVLPGLPKIFWAKAKRSKFHVWSHAELDISKSSSLS